MKKAEYLLVFINIISAFCLKLDFILNMKLLTLIYLGSLTILSGFYIYSSNSKIYKIIQTALILTTIGSFFRFFHLPGSSLIQIIGLYSILIISFILIKEGTNTFKQLDQNGILTLLISSLLIIQVILAICKNLSLARFLNIPIVGTGVFLFILSKDKETDITKTINILSLQSLIVAIEYINNSYIMI